MMATTATSDGAGSAPDRRPWRRGRLASLLLLPPTFAAALWLSGADSWRAYRSVHRKDVAVAPAGRAAAYGGSEWRLRSLVAVAPDPARPIPPGTAVLRVEIEVKPADAGAIARLSRCAVALTDERGRRWTQDGRAAAGAAARSTANPTSCDGDHRRRPAAGSWFVFEQRFLVPAAVADRVEPVIALPAKDEPGRALRLRRR
jgi:hypothetical protein